MALQDEQQLGGRICQYGLWTGGTARTDNKQQGRCDLQVVSRVASGLRAGLADAVPLATPTPDVPDGRVEVILGEAEPARDIPAAGGVGEDSGVSFTPLGAIVASYSWPTIQAFALVDCESSWDSWAVSWAGARGVFQLMEVHAWRFTERGWDYWVDVFVPERNVAIAHEIWLEQSWEPWDCK